MRRIEEIARDLLKEGKVSTQEAIAICGAVEVVFRAIRVCDDHPSKVALEDFLEGWGWFGREGLVELGNEG